MYNSYKKGDPRRLFHVRDWQGQLCGVDLPSKPFGYWCTLPGQGAELGGAASLGIDYKNPICVESCPETVFGSHQCLDESTRTTRVVPDYATHPVAGRYCLPQAGQHLLSAWVSNYKDHPIQKNIEDGVAAVRKGWKILLYALGFAVVASYAYIIFLECCAGVMICLCLFSVFVISLVCGILVLASAFELDGPFKSAGSLAALGIGPGAGLDGVIGSGDHDIDVAIGIAFLVVAFLFLCFYCCFKKAIGVCIKATESTAVFLVHSPSIFLEPVLNLAGRLILWTVMLIGFAYLLSTVEADSDVLHNFDFKPEDVVFVSFYLFMWMWLNELCTVQSQFVIANAAGRWYFTAHNDSGEKGTILTRCCCLLFDGYIASIRHFGSLCLGACLVSLMRPFYLVMSILMFVETIIDDAFRVLCCCCGKKCCSCCDTCFKKFFAYFGKMAFIELAINSKVTGCCCAYWKAAKAGADMMTSTQKDLHLDDIELLHGGTWLFTFLGMVLVGSGCSTLAVGIASHASPWNDTLSAEYVSNPAALAILSFLIGLVIALCFMLVFDTAWDALLLCTCYDLQDRSSNIPAMTTKVAAEPPQKTGFFASLTCSRFNKTEVKEEPFHPPVYCHSQMETLITGKKTGIKSNGMGSFATSVRTVS